LKKIRLLIRRFGGCGDNRKILVVGKRTLKLLSVDKASFRFEVFLDAANAVIARRQSAASAFALAE
jgi:hypothetical protein